MRNFVHTSLRTAINHYLTSTYSLLDSLSIVSRQSVLAIILLCLTLGVGNAWGTVATLTFSSSPSSGCTYTDNQSKSWTFTTDGGYLALDNSTTIHSGSGSKTASHVTFTSSAFTGATITQITITGYGSSCGAYATVNGSDFGTQNQTATSSGTRTFTGNVTVTGNVVVKIKRSSATKNAIYCSQVTVTYTTCTGLTMSSVTAVPGSGQIALSWSAVSHADSYTVSCKVKNTGVAAGTGTGSGKTGTSCTITGLTNDTEYTWSVEPVGSGAYCSSNTPATGDAIPGTYYTVTWKASGSSDVTTSVRSGTKPTFPDTPTSCDGTSTTFYGWAASGSTWSGKIDDISAKTIYTSASDMPNVSGAVTYHAVFAKATGSGTTTQAATIVYSPYSFSGSGWTTSATGGYSGNYLKFDSDGKSVTFTSPKGAISRFQFTYKLQSSTSCTGHSGTAWWIGSIKFYVSTDGGSNWSELTSKSINDISTGTGLGSDVAKDYTDLSSGEYNAIKVQLAKDCGNLAIKGLSATYSNATYSEYLTSCCTALGSINGSVSWANPTQAVVTWDKLDDQVSAWALSWSPNTAGSSITSAIADYGLTQKTATVSGLACGTEYTFTLTPTLKSGVCTPASNPTIESTSTKYSITKASVTGGSFTTKISSTAVTEACNSSTISIAATPSTGYTFSSWQITNDDNSDADVTSTLLGANSTTASTSFTMPSHRVTITPSFSCIEPVIGTDPASASYTEGASPSALTVAATLSSGTLTYKWQKSTNSGVSWTDESGTGYNTATYAAANINTSLSANGVQYRCIVGNSEGGCTVTSGVATITVTAASKCVAPTFSVSAGTYNTSQSVTISSSTTGSTIYYTTNGSTPTTSSSHGTEGDASASVTVSSSMTLKAFAYKSGMTDSDVSEAAYVICSTDPTFSTTSSSNITITGARITCGGITKGTCDIDAYGIVYGTSANPTGNAQQKGTDASSNVSSYYVDLTSLTAGTTYYARPYATVNGKTVYGTEISFTTLNTPVITVSETSRAFGTRKVDGSYEMTFTVSGVYLQGNIGLAVGGTNAAMFSVDETSLTPSTGTVSTTTITVTYTPTAAGSHSASISLTSTYATTKTVTLSGTGRYEDIYLTAMHEGVTAWSDYASGVTKAGDGYTIPNPGDIAVGDREGTGCEGIHYHFAGWVEESDKASPSERIVAASGAKDASNKTFWAVWEKEKAGSGTGYTQTTTVSAGDVVVIAEIDDAASEKTGRELSGFSSTATVYGLYSDFATTPAGTIEWTVEEGYNSTGVAFKNSSDEYLYLASAANSLSTTDSKSAQSSWSVTTDSERAKIVNNNWNTRIICWNGGSPRFACYASKDHGDEVSGSTGKYYYYPIFYKKNTISYEDPKVECVCSEDPVAGTAAVDAEGTFSASSIAVKATSASTGHADCSYTDYGFVWSTSVTTPTLVEATGAASTNCTKVQVGTSGEVTSFTGSLTGTFTANPIYLRSYVKNGKADGTYQYSSVVTINPRSVTFDLNGHGSSAPATQLVNNGSKAVDPSYSESVTGYIFGGWYKEAGCSNVWTFGTDVVSGENKTLYAKWTPITYSVRFNSNDANYLGTATGSMSDQSFDYDESKELTGINFSLAGYDFAGWALTPTGDVEHLDEAEVENLSSTNSAVVNLYAIWSPKNYDVTLAATNETSSVGEQVVTATYNAAMPTTKKGSGAVTAPSRTGYTFTGWEYSSTTYYNYNAGTSTLSSAHVWDQPNSTTTLTPKWSINSYTLTWDLAGGTVSVAGTGAEEGATGTPSSSVVYNSAITVPTVTKAGYNFAGWDDTPASNMPASNVTYTATWTAKTLNSISLEEASVSVYDGEIKYVNVIFDPTDILSKAFGQVAAPSYCVLNSYDSYNKLKITGGRAGADISVNRTETVSIKYTADETKTASISVTVKPLPTVTFVDLIHNKFDFANSGDGYTAATGVLISTVTTGVVSHAKKTPTHTDVSAPVGGNACETGHLHLMGWIRSDYSKVADYMNGTGEAPSVSDLTTAGAEYWFLPDADINVETYDGKTFYAVWAVEE